MQLVYSCFMFAVTLAVFVDGSAAVLTMLGMVTTIGNSVGGGIIGYCPSVFNICAVANACWMLLLVAASWIADEVGGANAVIGCSSWFNGIVEICVIGELLVADVTCDDTAAG